MAKKAAARPGSRSVSGTGNRESITPETTVRPKNRIHQRIESRASSKDSEATSDSIAQIMTAPEARKPPSTHWNRKGSARLSST